MNEMLTKVNIIQMAAKELRDSLPDQKLTLVGAAIGDIETAASSLKKLIEKQILWEQKP